MVEFRLAAVGFLFLLTACGFYLAEKRTGFRAVSYGKKQFIIGLCFGLLAILATETGVEIGGASINIRDAAPLTAGLLFGGPAGILAGIIGGTERFLASYWGVGTYTRIACSVAAVLSGILAAGVRRFLLDNKKPSWIYALAVSVTMEVFHMVLIFLTNLSDIQTAFTFVRQCALPMIAANAVTVMLSVLAVALLGKEKLLKPMQLKKLSQTFQLWLFLCVAIGFAVTSAFTCVLQTSIAENDTKRLLNLNLQDVRQSIHDASDRNLAALTEEIAAAVEKELSQENLDESSNLFIKRLAIWYNVPEINLIDADGVIIASTYPEFQGYHMAGGEQSAEFLVLLGDETGNILVQDYQPTAFDSSLYRKYAGKSLSNGGFVQVGYDARRFQRDIDEEVRYAAKNRHVAQNGSIIICDESLKIISDNEGYDGTTLNRNNIWDSISNLNEYQPFEAEVHGIPSYCSFTKAEGYYIVAVLPQEEAMFSRDISVHLIIFMEILVFAALFAYIYFLIKRLIVNNLRKINVSLARITGGDLNVVVDVRTNEEFASLSDDINSTVTTLKQYIAEAETRIDQELEYARIIQYSALPSVFPPYPNRKEFDLFASMETAKEVGGDFYDFYLLGEQKLAFLVADVSGKGIPAAMFMMRAKALLKSLTESGLELDEVFVRANDQLCEGNDANMFVTAWMGILDVSDGHLEFVNAGHNPPVILRNGSRFELFKTKPNLVLGVMDEMPYRKQETTLEPGEVLYLYTDGVTEAQNTEEQLFGEERLLRCLDQYTKQNDSMEHDSMEQLCHAAKTAVSTFTEGAEPFDDITMLAVRYNGIL